MKNKLLFSLFFIFSLSLFSLEILRPSDSLDEDFFMLKYPQEPFQIIFSGQNWLFQPTDSSILYLSDVVLSSEVRFNFKVSSFTVSGKIPLKFFYQDLARGEVFLKTIWIDIPISEKSSSLLDLQEEFVLENDSSLSSFKNDRPNVNTKFINWLDYSSFSKLSEETLLKGREQLIVWQDFEGAISLTKEREKRGHNVSRELGDLYYLKGDNRQAYQMYKKALQTSPDPETLTLVTLLSMLLEEESSLLDFLRYWITGFSPPEERVYLMILNYLISHEKWEIAFKWLNQYSFFYNKPNLKDYYYYLVGNFFESPSPYQDIYLSYEYYDKLLKDYPLSPYWDSSYDRVLIIRGFYLRE